MNAIALQPEQLIFASDNTIKTTSLKIAEAFEKRHDNVMRDIKKIISIVKNTDSEAFLKFEECQRINELANNKPEPYYEMDKDSFILVVMGYTGEKAMAIKIAYINAFNWMADQLQKQSQYGLKQLPESKTRKALPGGLTLEQQDCVKALVKDRAAELPKEKQAGAIIRQWSAIKQKFGCSYKQVGPENFANIVSLIGRLPLEGELLEKEPDATEPQNCFTISMRKGDGLTSIMLKFDNCEGGYDRYFVTVVNGVVMVQPLEPDHAVMREKQFIAYLTQERGYIVVKKSEVIQRLQG